MRTVSAATQQAWGSGDFSGPNRPMVRATIQRLSVRTSKYGTQTYASMMFGQSSVPLELPNIRSVKWSRSTEGAATMTMTLWNTEPLPLGMVPLNDGQLDQPGYYTPTRGKSFGTPPWSHTANGWQDWIVPDRLVRTYEGYGFNPAVAPEVDLHLYKSGTWLIDDVTFDGGIITIECRDVSRALLDQVLMPPIVPMESYPLYFSQYRQVQDPPTYSTVGGWIYPTFDRDVDLVHGFTSIWGHAGADAFDGNATSYWLSISYQSPRDDYSFAWLQGRIPTSTVSAVKIRTWGGPYQVYVSVYANGKWQGRQIVPYNPQSQGALPNGANIPYLVSARASREGWTTIKLPSAISGATRVRIALTSLYDTGVNKPYRYRAGIRDFQVSNAVTVQNPITYHQEPETSPPGFGDYSDIPKILLAYAGWHWPIETTAAYETYSNGTTNVHAPTTGDPVLSSGRVWGDIQKAGTAGVAPLPVNIWDKKPVMDGINYIKDVLGYMFFVDEDGAAIFRSPNIWSVGNWLQGVGRTTDVVVLSDETVLMGLSAKLSSRSIREKVFVGNLAGQVAGMSNGFNPYPSGLRRVGGFTDMHFLSSAECRIMADLITLRQLFTYRADTVTIPGYPALQVDDQVRLYERVSEEMYLHYISGIAMDWDAKTGKYTYQLSTHWLGDVPFSNWTFDPNELNPETQAYLEALGVWHK